MNLYVLKKRQVTLGGTGYRKILVVASSEQEARELAMRLNDAVSLLGLDVDVMDPELVSCEYIGKDTGGNNNARVLTSFIAPVPTVPRPP